MKPFTPKLFAVAAWAAAPLLPLLSPHPAAALSFAGAEVDPKSLPAPEENPSISSRSHADRNRLNAIIGQNLKLTAHTGQSAEAFARMLPVRQQTAKLIGLIEQTNRDRLPAPDPDRKLKDWLPRDSRLLPISDMQLTATTDLYLAIAQGNFQVEKAKSLDLAPGAGIALGSTGWTLTFVNQFTYRLVNVKTGYGVTVAGDPHLLDATGQTQYGNWTASKVVIELPSADPDNRLVLLCTASGGDASNGFGTPDEVVAITDHEAVTVRGLSTGSPTAVHTADPYFVYRARQDELRGAPQYFWDEKSRELRTAGGERPGAPSRDYQTSVPGLASDAEQTGLLNGHFKLATANPEGVDRMDQEVFEIARQAKAAADHPGADPASASVKQKGRTFLDDVKPFADRMIDYGKTRAKLVEQLEKLRNQLEVLRTGVSDGNTMLDDVDRLGEQLAAKTKEVEAVRDQILRLDAKSRQDRDRQVTQ